MTAFDETAFRSLLKGWILGFHTQIREISPDELERRLASYVDQETLYAETVGFIRHIFAERGVPLRRVLDLGSSAGGLSVALALSGLEVVGIEPSLSGVEASELRARRRGIETASFLTGVGEKLPFADGEFDAVVSLAVLEHVQDPERVVREVFRVLRPGGGAYFEVPNYLCPFEPHYKIAWLPMMPKALAKTYVRLRGGRPQFLDELNYMNWWIISGLFRRAGFVDTDDLYAEFLAGKASGAAWSSRSGRLAQIPFAPHVVRALFSRGPTAWFLNRIVCLAATKPAATT